MNLQQLSQPFEGTEAQMQDFLMPVRTTAELASVTNAINTLDKYTGKLAYNSTISQIVAAVSGVASSAWNVQPGKTPVNTTAQLVDETDVVNTIDKYAGKMVWDSTLGLPVWADGAGINDTWSLATGVVSTTPT